MNAIIELADRNRSLPDWAREDLIRNGFKRNNHEIQRYVGIQGKFGSQVRTVIGQFAGKKITKEQAMDQMRQHLTRAENEAFIAGKRAAKKKILYITPEEQKMLNGRMSRNMRYFSSFVDAISNGTTRMPIMQRADAYAKSMWSIYNRGQSDIDWADPDPAERWAWVCQFDKEVCSDCWERYRISHEKDGLTFDDLIELGFPGERTKCMYSCRCHLRRLPRAKPRPPQAELEAQHQEKPPEGVPRPVQTQSQPPYGPEREPSPIEVLMERLAAHNTTPVTMPAAGLPRVSLRPSEMANVIRNAGSYPKAEALIDALPTLLDSALLRPLNIIPVGDTERTYIAGDGSKVYLKREPNGLWFLSNVLMADKNGPK